MTTINVTTIDQNEPKRGDITEIVTIVDRSGSMASSADDAIGSFNSFLGRQKQAGGKARFTLVQFNDRCQTVCSGIDIKDALPYDRETYVPSGNTALLDAVGSGINDVLVRTAGRHSSKVLFAILTDGHENSSRHFTRDNVRGMIESLKKASGWEFIFLGVDMDKFDAEATGYGMGIRADKVAVYLKNKEGIDEAAEAMSNAALEYRKTGKLESDRWKKEKFG